MLNRVDGPVRLYCFDMSGTPKAYITLKDPNKNYGSNYSSGARTKFSRVTLDTRVRNPKVLEYMQKKNMVITF